MEKIKIVIDNMDNAAFENEEYETVRILKDIVEKIERGDIRSRKLLDINGNTVGYLDIE